MTTHNPDNERIKRRYLAYLKEARRQSEASVDAAAKALARFEASTDHRDLKLFRIEQAIAFKRALGRDGAAEDGGALSKATLYATFAHLKRFFVWLAGQPGYRSRLNYSDADYFNLSDKDARVATARRERPFPTVEQVNHVIKTMPAGSDVEMRNRALIAFALMTAARDGAIASLKLKHIDLVVGRVDQDAREVRTKASKTITTYFFKVGAETEKIFSDWVLHLRKHLLWGNDDPLFPATSTGLSVDRRFHAVGLRREHWATAAPIRAIFRQAFTAAGFEYANPHSLRRTLVQFGEAVCQTPEQFKAWSQNLGHEQVLTTFSSYGAVAVPRQGEIIKSLDQQRPAVVAAEEFVLAVVRRELGRFGGPDAKA